jgi:hypothetical protein
VSLLLVSRDSRCLQQFSVSFLAVDLEMRPEPVRLLTFKSQDGKLSFYFEHHTADDSVDHYDFYEYTYLGLFYLNRPAIFDVFRCGKTLFSLRLYTILCIQLLRVAKTSNRPCLAPRCSASFSESSVQDNADAC